jgi:hypothetical protein
MTIKSALKFSTSHILNHHSIVASYDSKRSGYKPKTVRLIYCKPVYLNSFKN